MSPTPEPDASREATNPGFRLWEPPPQVVDERTRLPLGLIISLLGLLGAGAIQAGIAWSQLSDQRNRLDKLEVISQERSLKQQHLEDELVHIREAVERVDNNVRDLKGDMRRGR